MNNVMLDLETLGTTPGCVVLSIGAVEFDPDTGELGREYYDTINQSSSLAVGLETDLDTVAWWKKQSLEAQKVLYATHEDNGTQIAPALAGFAEFLAPCGKSLCVWGNGSDFDQPILAAAYKAVGQKTPWLFWNNRCYRTLKNIKPEIALSRVGTYHNALDDAKSQALHAIAIFKLLTS